MQDKLDSLLDLQRTPNHLELLEKILLDSATESFSTDLGVSFELRSTDIPSPLPGLAGRA